MKGRHQRHRRRFAHAAPWRDRLAPRVRGWIVCSSSRYAAGRSIDHATNRRWHRHAGYCGPSGRDRNELRLGLYQRTRRMRSVAPFSPFIGGDTGSSCLLALPPFSSLGTGYERAICFRSRTHLRHRSHPLGMTDPGKVIGFLDVTGDWDPSLAFVMGGAILIGFFAFRLAGKRAKSFLGGAMHLPHRRDIDKRLVSGSVLSASAGDSPASAQALRWCPLPPVSARRRSSSPQCSAACLFTPRPIARVCARLRSCACLSR